MRNSVETPKQHGDESIAQLLAETRKDERRGRADLMSARLDTLAAHIASKKLSCAEAAGLLRQEAENIQCEAQELC